MIALDLATAEQLCRDWQGRLGLRDWRITLRAGNTFTMGRESITGSVAFDVCERAARLEVLLGAGDDDAIVPHDPEAVIVHELLHVLFVPFQAKDDKSAKGVAQEQAINAIAWALVRLARSGALPAESRTTSTDNE